MILAYIHDEILLDIPIESTNEMILIQKETMEEAGATNAMD